MQRRSTLFIVLTLSLLIATAGCSLLPDLTIHDPVRRDNLIVNPGFEELDNNGRPVGWRIYVPRGHADGAKISPEARSGDHAALIDVAAALPWVVGEDVRQNFEQKISAHSDFVLPGKKYRFSAYYRTEGNPRARLTVQIPGLDHPTTGNLPPAEDWTYVELIFEWPPPDKSVAAGLWVWNASEGKVWFDDVELVLIED